MKFLICGLGSIGKRHMNNLETLGFPCKNILIFRTRKGTASFGDNALASHNHLHPVFYDLNGALAENPDVVFVTNPTSLHIPTALEAAKAGCHLLIEKPLSHTMEQIDELIRIVGQKQLVTLVAYNLRFHPLLLQIKKWLEDEKIGRVVTVHAEMAERVTDYHPWENFRVSYAVRQELGGGVILTQCHELDYLYWLFGKPKWIFATGGELGNLGIGTEDICKSVMEFGGGIIASLHVDYLKRPPRCFLEITGTEGRIYWNYFDRKADFIPVEGSPISVPEPEGFERNTMHIGELSYFLRCIANKKPALPSLEQGKDVLEMILATKESLLRRRVVPL